MLELLVDVFALAILVVVGLLLGLIALAFSVARSARARISCIPIAIEDDLRPVPRVSLVAAIDEAFEALEIKRPQTYSAKFDVSDTPWYDDDSYITTHDAAQRIETDETSGPFDSCEPTVVDERTYDFDDELAVFLACEETPEPLKRAARGSQAPLDHAARSRSSLADRARTIRDDVRPRPATAPQWRAHVRLVRARTSS